MVLIHVKRTDVDQFLFETTVTASNDDVIRELVAVWNKRLEIQRLIAAVLELAKHGPARPEDKRGLEYDDDEKKMAESYGNYCPDPTCHRNGDAPSAELAETLNRMCDDAAAIIHKTQVDRKVPINVPMLQERVDNIRGAVMMAYPMGLPEHDVIRLILEGNEVLEGTSASRDVLDPDSAELWWAGKEFLRDQTVGDRVGRNEKTKIVGKLQKRGGGPPSREPGISEDERKAMMAFYYKKQEEAKRAAEDDEDAFLHSSWADPKALKSSLLGTGSVSFLPGKK